VSSAAGRSPLVVAPCVGRVIAGAISQAARHE
jgi:hypothetical protein